MIDAVSQRYVDALFRLAKSKGALDAVRADVQHIAPEFAKPAVARFLLDARIPAKERQAKIARMLEAANPLVRNFVGLLFQKKRESVLPNVAAAFQKRWLQETGAVEGTVESARPLGEPEITKLEQALGQKLGKSVKLVNELRPDLIGGVRVIVDNRLLDWSVQGRLEGMRKRMLEAQLPAARA